MALSFGHLAEKAYLCSQCFVLMNGQANTIFINNRQPNNAITHNMEPQKVIITVVGKDTVGIIASVCTYLADKNINILDISQTIVQEYFNMMMIVDICKCNVPFDEMRESLNAIGEEKGVQIKCQKEEIFDKMHRI